MKENVGELIRRSVLEMILVYHPSVLLCVCELALCMQPSVLYTVLVAACTRGFTRLV